MPEITNFIRHEKFINYDLLLKEFSYTILTENRNFIGKEKFSDLKFSREKFSHRVMSENSNFIEKEKSFNNNSLAKVFHDKNICCATVKKRVRKKNFQCEVCQKKFSSRFHMDDHMLIHTGETPHTCDICNKKFAQKSNFKRHLLVHTKERRFSCDICFKKFTYKQHFQQHLRVHTGEKPYECEICGRKFSNRTLMKTHMITHSELKPFACKVCGVRFRRNKTLKSHIMRNHAEVSRTHVCNTCKKSFATEKALQNHSAFLKLEKPVFNNFIKQIKTKEIRHGSDCKQNYKCHECTESFKSENDLQKHVQNHEFLKSFICYQCEIEFITAYDLIEHLRSCMGKKPSVCEKNLQKHIQNNKSLKPFLCYQCETGFMKSYDLIKHLRTCTGEKSYASSNCGSEFANKVTLLKQHCNIQNTIESSKSDMCEEPFNMKNNVDSNLKMHQEENNRENSDLINIEKNPSLKYVASDDIKLGTTLENDDQKKFFSCSVCQEVFAQKDLLNEHILSHTTVNETNLIQCELSFEYELSKEELSEECLM